MQLCPGGPKVTTTLTHAVAKVSTGDDNADAAGATGFEQATVQQVNRMMVRRVSGQIHHIRCSKSIHAVTSSPEAASSLRCLSRACRSALASMALGWMGMHASRRFRAVLLRCVTSSCSTAGSACLQTHNVSFAARA